VKVKIEKPTEEKLRELDVENWPIWEKEVSTFDWHYDTNETFYVIEGEVEVELDDGTKVSFGAGDLVTFSEGVKCTWHVKKPIRKHYKLF